MTIPIPELSGTALVIDDQEPILSVAEDILTATGMSVLLAQSGTVGISLFQEHHQTIDLVLLDMKMPDMNGDEVFAHLQAIDPTVRVIVASGFDERETMAHFANLEAVRFIQKPYQFRALIEKIASTLAEKR
jgi:two-component system, cell cycle sensor histidine kinase and response regulator CckA